MTVKDLYETMTKPDGAWELNIYTSDGNTCLAIANSHYKADGTTDCFPDYRYPYSIIDLFEHKVVDIGVGYHSLWIHIDTWEGMKKKKEI